MSDVRPVRPCSINADHACDLRDADEDGTLYCVDCDTTFHPERDLDPDPASPPGGETAE